MNLKNLKSLFINNGCKEVLVKTLAPNDNSKNQVYFGGNFEIINTLPISEIETVDAGDWKRERFKASINFAWLTEEGNLSPAPRKTVNSLPEISRSEILRFSFRLQECTFRINDTKA